MDEEKYIRIIERERKARKAAERYMEEKSSELYDANLRLKALNEELIRRSGDSERKYQNLLEALTDVVYTLDENGDFTYMNETGLNLLGISKEQLIGTRFSEFLGEREEVVMSFYEKQVEEQRTHSYLEIPIDINGKRRWFGQNANLLFQGDKLHEVYVVARDITMIKDTQNLLEESEKKYRGMIENMHLGLMEVSLDDRIISMNASFCEMSGYAESELIGKNPKDLFLLDEDKDLMNSQENRRAQGVGELYEIRFRCKGGDVKWLMISGAPSVNKDGKVTGTVGIHYDITERKHMEVSLLAAQKKAQQAEEQEKAFLARMSHEIRTPLNAIIGMSHLMFDTELSEEQREYMRSIHYSTQLLKGLVTDVLDYSKITSGQLNFIPSSFSLYELAHSIQQMFRFLCSEKNIEFILDYHRSAPDQIFFDKVVLNQILLNLIGNSIKFTDEGWVSMSISGTSDQKNFIISIADTGLGMEQDEIEGLFKKFQRSKDDAARLREGSGLGLSIVQLLVEHCKGEIAVKSNKGKGSFFRITLPYQEAEVEELRPMASIIEDKELSILVAEDNQMNQQYLTNLLQKMGHQVKVVQNGAEAVDICRKQLFDLIFMDVQMPVMDGLEATKRIRTAEGGLNAFTRIIGLSAFAFKQDIEASIIAGMDDYLTKPFVPSDIYLVVQDDFTKHEDETSSLEALPGILDRKYLMELYGEDEGHLHEMLQLYLETCPPLLEDLKQECENKDYDSLSRNLHKLGPMTKMIGNVSLADEIVIWENRTRGRGMSDKSFIELFDVLDKVEDTLRVTSEYMNSKDKS